MRVARVHRTEYWRREVAQIENSRDLQRVTLEYSPEQRSTYVCKETMSAWGKNRLKEVVVTCLAVTWIQEMFLAPPIILENHMIHKTFA